MASRIIHLAVTGRIARVYECKDQNRLNLGSILPDAAADKNSHMRITVCDGTKKTYDLTGFRALYLKNILEDDLYLGYYLHLVQDLLFRNFVYNRYHWNPLPDGNVERLHNDYALINRYVIDQYGLSDNIIVPTAFETEPICKEHSFSLNTFLNEMKADFESVPTGEIFFFTRQMADEYIDYAAKMCLREIDALYNQSECIDEIAFAWNRR